MASYSFTLPTWIIVNNILMTRILNKLKKHFITLDLFTETALHLGYI